MKKARVLLYVYPLVLSLVVVNPLLFELVSEHITATAYWRLFWLAPMTIALPLIGVQFVNTLKAKIWNSPRKLPAWRGALPVSCIISVFIVFGNFVYGSNIQGAEPNLTRDKLPPGVSDIIGHLDSLPDGVVLAAHYPAIFLHNSTTKHELLAPRALDLRVHFGEGTTGYNFRMSLLALTNSREVRAFPVERFHLVIRRYGTDYIVFEPGNEYIKKYAKTYNSIELYRNEHYIIIKAQY